MVDSTTIIKVILITTQISLHPSKKKQRVQLYNFDLLKEASQSSERAVAPILVLTCIETASNLARVLSIHTKTCVTDIV